MILPDREALADVANALGLTTAVEVGTHQAVFASQFMKRFRGSITLIDPWEGFDGIFPTYYPAFNDLVEDREQDFEIAKTAMAEFGGRAKFIRKKSEDAVIEFEDESVGIVYIDAHHDFENASRDVFSWYPKVAVGGIISGHDYHHDYSGVIRAVSALSEFRGVEINITADQMFSWWGIKKCR
jgi:hypothetical protein